MSGETMQRIYQTAAGRRTLQVAQEIGKFHGKQSAEPLRGPINHVPTHQAFQGAGPGSSRHPCRRTCQELIRINSAIRIGGYVVQRCPVCMSDVPYTSVWQRVPRWPDTTVASMVNNEAAEQSSLAYRYTFGRVAYSGPNLGRDVHVEFRCKPWMRGPLKRPPRHASPKPGGTHPAGQTPRASGGEETDRLHRYNFWPAPSRIRLIHARICSNRYLFGKEETLRCICRDTFYVYGHNGDMKVAGSESCFWGVST